MRPFAAAFVQAIGLGAVAAGWAIACGADERFEVEASGSPDAGFEGASDAVAADVDANGPDADADASESPTLPLVPVGLDAYRMWDRLPTLRLGVRAHMRSTYDRRGGNEAADASHFIRQLADDHNVTLDVAGPGVLYFVRTNHWHGSPWLYTVDGAPHTVSESSTIDPTQPVANSVFLPEAAFPSPLTYTWSTTRGADLSWVPIPFQKSFELAYGRTHYGTGYYVYHSFAEGADHLSAPITTWNEEPPAADVLAFIGSAGEDIAPNGPGVTTTEGTRDLLAGATVSLAELAGGPSTLRALRIRVPKSEVAALEKARLVVHWDGRAEASIDAPVPLFFGTGTFYDRAGVEWLVKGLLVNVRFVGEELVLSMYYPMPYEKSARFELVAGDQPITGLSFSLRTQASTQPMAHQGYFHATYRDHATPEPGKDLVIFDSAEVEGGAWCGSFLGMSFIFSDQATLWTLEGDPRFFFDDSQTPQAQGTGTEEWGGGGDYWGGATMTLPFAGHPVGAPSKAAVQAPADAIESAYRFLLADLMPFGRRARIQLEHGPLNDSTEHYRSVAYWYGAPGSCLVLSDTLDVGKPADEAAHDYVSAQASTPETLTSRFEWGPDHLGNVELYPETQEDGRHTTGTSEFTLSLDPKNLGMLLRRTLDYAIPNQRAEVWVADTTPGAPFVRAGTWYLAGSSRVVYSNPPGELGATEHVVQTSNRRFRDDEFQIAKSLTQGKSKLRVRIVHVPVDVPLHPTDPLVPSAWSELRYSAYCWKLPVG